jgi:hypothetical protein
LKGENAGLRKQSKINFNEEQAQYLVGVFNAIVFSTLAKPMSPHLF